MSIGTFILVKNENPWIAPHILQVLPHVDEMVFYDGNSTDGTLEIIKAIRDNEPGGGKIKLFENQDPKNLQEDYVHLFNEAMHSLSTDLAWFLHPDMWVVNPEQIALIKDSPAVALSTRMRSFAGEPGQKLYEIKGRGEEWKNIYRLRNPDLGAHYFGFYGAQEEDIYFSAITGKSHEIYQDFNRYPYSVVKSGIDVLHFSDVRTRARRVSRMVKCLLNNGWTEDKALARAEDHPRVNFLDKDGFTFQATQYPNKFLEQRNKYAHLIKELQLA